MLFYKLSPKKKNDPLSYDFGSFFMRGGVKRADLILFKMETRNVESVYWAGFRKFIFLNNGFFGGMLAGFGKCLVFS